MGAREQAEADLLGRIELAKPLARVALRWDRLALAAALALLPAAALLLASWLGPAELRAAIVDTRNVHDTFARFVSGVATASSIAVSIAALVMRRELHGLTKLEERHETNTGYRRRVRDRLQAREMPIMIAPFLAEVLDDLARMARETRSALSPGARRLASQGLALEAYLAALDARGTDVAAKLREAHGRPDRILLAALDFEHEVTTRLAHRFARHEALTDDERARLEALRDLLDDFVLMQKFLKTLDTQWGLSRMSAAILLSTLPSIVTAALMVLAYGSGAVDALGELGAAALVCVALAVVLFPLTCFVSYVIRFLVVNQHTLPTDGFLLGPEARALRR